MGLDISCQADGPRLRWTAAYLDSRRNALHLHRQSGPHLPSYAINIDRGELYHIASVDLSSFASRSAAGPRASIPHLAIGAVAGDTHRSTPCSSRDTPSSHNLQQSPYAAANAHLDRGRPHRCGHHPARQTPANHPGRLVPSNPHASSTSSVLALLIADSDRSAHPQTTAARSSRPRPTACTTRPAQRRTLPPLPPARSTTSTPASSPTAPAASNRPSRSSRLSPPTPTLTAAQRAPRPRPLSPTSHFKLFHYAQASAYLRPALRLLQFRASDSALLKDDQDDSASCSNSFSPPPPQTIDIPALLRHPHPPPTPSAPSPPTSPSTASPAPWILDTGASLTVHQLNPSRNELGLTPLPGHRPRPWVPPVPKTRSTSPSSPRSRSRHGHPAQRRRGHLPRRQPHPRCRQKAPRYTIPAILGFTGLPGASASSASRQTGHFLAGPALSSHRPTRLRIYSDKFSPLIEVSTHRRSAPSSCSTPEPTLTNLLPAVLRNDFGAALHPTRKKAKIRSARRRRNGRHQNQSCVDIR